LRSRRPQGFGVGGSIPHGLLPSGNGSYQGRDGSYETSLGGMKMRGGKYGYGVGVLLLILVCLALIVLPAADAWARAGGGGGYSGGGGGGGGGGFSGGGGSGFSSGGGSGSGGDLGPGGIVVVILVIVVIIVLKVLEQSNKSHKQSVIRRGGVAMTAVRRQQAVDTLKNEDPEFSDASFYSRVRDGFLKIQEAWSNQELEALRPFVSDGIFERFTLQIQEQQDLGYRNVMENVQVRSSLIAGLSRDDLFDVLHVEINASATDYRIDRNSGKEIRGSRRGESFVEYWSFIRRRGTQTKPGAEGLIEGTCPNCGSSLRFNKTAKCEACDALIRSGQYDWVLSEITQACEWTGGESREPTSVTAYRQQCDSGFNVQHLEDRASVIFWRKAMADRVGEVGPLEKMATPAFTEDYEKHVRKASDEGERRYIGDCAVGSVDTLGILRGEEGDQALVEVRWSGHYFQHQPNREPKKLGAAPARQWLFVLTRDPGVKTEPDQSLTSAHCPGCGAPELKLGSHACEFCGMVLNDGSRDWVLADVQPAFAPPAKQLVIESRQQGRAAMSAGGDVVDAQIVPAIPVVDAEVLADDEGVPPPGGTALFAWLIRAALADNHIDDAERKMLDSLATKRGVRSDRLEAMIDAALRNELEMPRPKDAAEAKNWLTAMVDMSLSDGRLTKSEFNLLKRAGAGLQMSDHDVKLLVRRRKGELYREARDALAEQKRLQA